MSPRLILWPVVTGAILLALGAASLWSFRVREREHLAALEERMIITGTALAQALAKPLANDPIPVDDLAEIRRMIVHLQDSSGSRIRIFSRRLDLLEDSFGLPEGQPHLRFRPEITRAIKGEYGAYTRFADETGKSLALFAALPVKRGDEVVGVVYVSHNTDEILQRLGELRRLMRNGVMGLTVLLLLIVLALSGRLAGTLRRIRDVSGKMSRGDLKERVEVRGTDEVARIAEHFNRLADSLREKIRELEEEREKTKRFVQDMSHELKTPLTGVAGSVEALMAGGWDEPDHCRRFVRNIKHDADRLSRLVSDLLTLQKLEHDRVRREPFDLVPLTGSVLAHFAPAAARRSVGLRLDAPPEALAEGDPRKIRTVLENLLENALRFAPDGTTIRCRVTSEEATVTVEVADQGPGVPVEERERIFERFYRGGRAADGPAATSGLGLAIAREIITRHNGTIGVENDPEGGSRFYFTLKRSQGPGDTLPASSS